MISIDKIKVENPYLRIDDDVDNLIESIKKIGIINPLTINENFELLAGGRRYSAAKELGVSEVPVIKVERSDLEQELISIDENLVRKGLNKIQFDQCLNRGREIYEKLNPELKKVDLTVENKGPEEKKKEKIEDENDQESFAAIISKKTGLSKGVIKGAIKRDALSSKSVKESREKGEISSSQTNELIRLEKEEQEKILPHIKDRTVKEIKKMVNTAKEDGVDFAINQGKNMVTPPKEYVQLLSCLKRTNRSLSKILLEELDHDGEIKKSITKELKGLLEKGSNFIHYYTDESFAAPAKKDQNSEMNISQ